MAIRTISFFVDDYTQVIEKVNQNITEIITQHSITSKILCTGNALDFVQEIIRTFSANGLH